jgi:hypothetical protein
MRMTAEAGTHPSADTGYGLRPRPAPDPVVLALVSTAVEQLFTGPPAAARDAEDVAHLTWRFSGRWWARPLPVRRHRPWVG